jgi:hypothetical protein
MCFIVPKPAVKAKLLNHCFFEDCTAVTIAIGRQSTPLVTMLIEVSGATNFDPNHITRPQHGSPVAQRQCYRIQQSASRASASQLPHMLIEPIAGGTLNPCAVSWELPTEFQHRYKYRNVCLSDRRTALPHKNRYIA